MADEKTNPGLRRRVRIQSQGPMHTAKFTDADTGADLPAVYRAELVYDWGADKRLSPTLVLTMLFPTVDVIADAEIRGAVTHDTLRLRELVKRMTAYLETLPSSDEKDDLLNRGHALAGRQQASGHCGGEVTC